MMRQARLRITIANALVWAVALPAVSLFGQTQCDPNKVMTAEKCAQCHLNEIKVWKSTPHYRTFEELNRRPEAREICKNLGLRSAKRSDVCVDCHFTTVQSNGRIKPVSGISCESCHGAAKDWVNIHNDYGGPTVSKESETPEHRAQRWATSVANGMKNTRELYMIARSCFGCHTVPNEELVNVGGHNTGSMDFELVAWSQGQVRHNFLRTGGVSNATSDIERLRVMYVAGLIAELEFSTRAVAQATEKSNYGVTVANRAARTAVKLFKLQQQINDPDVLYALQSFAGADLKINNNDQLTKIADQIMEAGNRFTASVDGSGLAVVDPMLPTPDEYK